MKKLYFFITVKFQTNTRNKKNSLRLRFNICNFVKEGKHSLSALHPSSQILLTHKQRNIENKETKNFFT